MYLYRSFLVDINAYWCSCLCIILSKPGRATQVCLQPQLRKTQVKLSNVHEPFAYSQVKSEFYTVHYWLTIISKCILIHPSICRADIRRQEVPQITQSYTMKGLKGQKQPPWIGPINQRAACGAQVLCILIQLHSAPVGVSRYSSIYMILMHIIYIIILTITFLVRKLNNLNRPWNLNLTDFISQMKENMCVPG